MIDTFICANTKNGFFSLQNEVINERAKRVYVIKGGPGTGKSTLIRRVAAAVGAAELIHCSSDPDSLDGAVLSDGTVLFDGTSPHLAEPPLPGAAGRIINTGELWDESKLIPHKNEIAALSAAISEEYRAAYSLLSAAGKADELVSSAALPLICCQRISEYSKSLVKRRLKEKEGKGNISKRFLSAHCHKGTFTLKDTILSLSNERIFLNDKYLSVADAVMKEISERAVLRGHDVICFFSPLDPSRISHAVIPGASLCFTTDPSLATRKVNCARFLKEVISFPNRLKLYSELSKSALFAAKARLCEAKRLHDELEKYYVAALDKRASEQLAAKIISEIS
ncbi:MAG: hypothetical protein IJD95_06090 [Clostridia bacterium]|nr:hypothetical protein [Clostridia bacterium]